MHPRRWLHRRTRRRIGERFLSGAGIEIGALHNPFPVPSGARVRYLDRLTTAQLREEYPELSERPFPDVELIDDGQTLATLPDGEQDFVVAGHVLEHTEDPIAALRAQLRVLRPGGVVVLALPDRRTGLDELRSPTSLEHLLADHDEGPQRSRTQHYREWAELVDVPLGFVEAGDVDRHVDALLERGERIHFHCWTLEEFASQLPAFGLAASVVEARANGEEFLVVLRKA